MAGIQIFFVCSAFRLASYIVREMEITSFLDLLVLKVDIILLCSFV